MKSWVASFVSLTMELPIILFTALSFTCVFSQTTDSNPAFVNIAPCACDLTGNQYDNNCCCDPDGSPGDISISSCIPGPYGGNFTILDDRLCTTAQAYTSDWFPLTCIQFLNSPDLGLYYYPSTALSAAIVAEDFTYEVQNDAVSTYQCAAIQYNATDPILASYQNSANCETLRFPQTSAAGECVRNSQVRFLQDSSASCDTTVTDDLCTPGSILDAAYYTTAQVAALTTQVGTVIYNCAGSTDDQSYVKTNTGFVATTSQSLFGTSSTSNSVDCGDDSPSVDGGVCQNAVASVSYTLTWNATNITSFDIAITLVNVTLTDTSNSIASGGPNFVLTQVFTTTFIPSDSANAVSHSGFPGYEFGLPVLSGGLTGGGNLSVWKPGSSGLCTDATLVAPSFGFDSLSGCQITFGVYNCTDLRSLVETEQLKLLNATLVSRFGNPSTDVTTTDWISIVNNVTSFIEPDNTTGGQCEGIPSRAVLEFMWAKTGEQSGTAIREIVGARVSLVRETWNILCGQNETSCAVSNYFIYSTATFTEVPPQAPTPQTSYELNRNDTCRKDATCWSELLLPIQPEFFYLYNTTTANTLRTYNYAWTIFVTFFSIAAAVVPAHWSSIGRYLKQVLPI